MHKSLYHPVRVGKTLLPGNLILAPLAGYSDCAFRELCLEHGADFTFTEMVSVEGVLRENPKTFGYLTYSDIEKQYGVQIFTASPENALKIAPILEQYAPSIIDINCGCPVPKVVKSGSGSALMRQPKLIGKIVRALTEHTDIPVTVKLRSGWEPGEITCFEAAASAVEAGASAITLHPRTKTQGYGGNADHTLTKELVKQSNVPVFASGDIFTPEDAEHLLSEVGCDGVFFARGAVGNPFIFEATKTYLTEGYKPIKASKDQILKTASDHIRKAKKYLGDEAASKEMKKHLCGYIKGIDGASKLRNALVHTSNTEQMVSLIEKHLAV